MERKSGTIAYLLLALVLLAGVSEIRIPPDLAPYLLPHSAPDLLPDLSPAPAPDPSPDDLGQVNALVAAHNAARTDHRLAPLARNELLVSAARKHAEHMAARRTLAHMGIGDGTPWERIAREGYHYSAASENAAWNQATVPQVMKDWLHSPGHRAAILGPYTEMGAFVAYDRENHPFWCAVFATPIK